MEEGVGMWPKGGSLFRREVGTACMKECHMLGMTGSLLGPQYMTWGGEQQRGD